MRQRVAFARTLLTGKPVLLLDEPFGSLDSITRAEMQQWLAERLAEQPHTVVLVTHDVEEALYLCDRVARALAATGPPAARSSPARRATACPVRAPSPRPTSCCCASRFWRRWRERRS